MADISTITLDNTIYNIKDTVARQEVANTKKFFIEEQEPQTATEGDVWFQIRATAQS